MIALLAAATLQTSRVIEWFDPNSDFATIQAVIALPELDRRNRNLLAMICGNLGKETATFGGDQISDLAARVGSRLKVVQMPDHLRVSLEVVNADLPTGLSMMGSILRESKFDLEKIQSIGQDMQFRQMPFWRQAIDGEVFELPKYTQREVFDLIERVFRPENVTIGVGGKVLPGQATAKWNEYLSSWKMPRLNQQKLTDTAPGKVGRLAGSASVLELSGPTFAGTDAAFNTKLLALTALGTGKGAALWRVAREKLRLSYRQEAVLYPTTKGFQARLLIAHSGSEDLEKKAEAITAGLLSDIENWTEDDRRRAIGMAESYLVRGGDMNPLYFAPGRPITQDLPDQVFMRAYWQMKTGSQWNPHQIVGRMGFVELKDLKETATEFVKNAGIRIHQAG